MALDFLAVSENPSVAFKATKLRLDVALGAVGPAAPTVAPDSTMTADPAEMAVVERLRILAMVDEDDADIATDTTGSDADA